MKSIDIHWVKVGVSINGLVCANYAEGCAKILQLQDLVISLRDLCLWSRRGLLKIVRSNTEKSKRARNVLVPPSKGRCGLSIDGHASSHQPYESAGTSSFKL